LQMQFNITLHLQHYDSVHSGRNDLRINWQINWWFFHNPKLEMTP
jgi:hypothetical protein